ncbi:MAG: dihydroorotate oxidase, partial [Planctomycetota bacterium]
MTEFIGFIGDIKFHPPIMNASGVLCTTEEDLQAVLESRAGACVTKTMTLEPREGNPKPRCFWTQDFSVNSMGIPNKGVEYYVEAARRLKKYQKPMIASMAGLQKEEYFLLSEKLEKSDFHAIEVNLSCPNLEGKEIFAYDFQLAKEVLYQLRKRISKPMGVKLPPYSSRYHIQEIAKILLEVSVDFVSLSNSFPLGTAILSEKEETAILPNGGIGGLGGKAFRPIVLGQILLFQRHFKGQIPIIGVGGIEKGVHLYEHLLAGASLFQIGTALLREGPFLFQKILEEANHIFQQKGLSSYRDKCGKVKAPSPKDQKE